MMVEKSKMRDLVENDEEMKELNVSRDHVKNSWLCPGRSHAFSTFKPRQALFPFISAWAPRTTRTPPVLLPASDVVSQHVLPICARVVAVGGIMGAMVNVQWKSLGPYTWPWSLMTPKPRRGSKNLVRGPQRSFDPKGGPWAQNLLKIGVSPKNCLKTAWFGRNLVGKGGRPKGPSGSAAETMMLQWSPLNWSHVVNLFTQIKRQFVQFLRIMQVILHYSDSLSFLEFCQNCVGLFCFAKNPIRVTLRCEWLYQSGNEG